MPAQSRSCSRVPSGSLAPGAAARALLCAALLDAMLASVEDRGDADLALNRVDSMELAVPHLCGGDYVARSLVLARLHEARGDRSGALAAVRRRGYSRLDDSVSLFLLPGRGAPRRTHRRSGGSDPRVSTVSASCAPIRSRSFAHRSTTSGPRCRSWSAGRRMEGTEGATGSGGNACRDGAVPRGVEGGTGSPPPGQTMVTGRHRSDRAVAQLHYRTTTCPWGGAKSGMTSSKAGAPLQSTSKPGKLMVIEISSGGSFVERPLSTTFVSAN